jgi:uncharacterized membrane protein
MKLRYEIKLQAKTNFRSQYGVCVLATLIYTAITFALSGPPAFLYMGNLWETVLNFGRIPYIGVPVDPSMNFPFFAATLLLMPPIIVGFAQMFLRVYRGGRGDIGEAFGAGFRDYGRNLGGILWMDLFIFLWTLLFIVPGIIKAIAYSMTPYILADSKKVRPTEALKLSMRMTYGYKGRIFVMYLSFIGWLILSALTFQILFVLYVGPYMQASLAGQYDELKKNAIEKGTITAAELE